MAREEVETGIDPNHHSSRNRFSCWPCLRGPSLHGLYARLSGFSDGRVAIGSYRGHRIGIGVFAFSTGSKVAGTICVLTNIPVLAYWGFVGAFFSMGGSV